MKAMECWKRGRCVLTSVIAAIIIGGCSSDPNAVYTLGRIEDKMPCSRTAEFWHHEILNERAEKNAGGFSGEVEAGELLNRGASVVAVVREGDKVNEIDDREADEWPDTVSQIGAVTKIHLLSGPFAGKTCWIFSIGSAYK